MVVTSKNLLNGRPVIIDEKEIERKLLDVRETALDLSRISPSVRRSHGPVVAGPYNSNNNYDNSWLVDIVEQKGKNTIISVDGGPIENTMKTSFVSLPADHLHYDQEEGCTLINKTQTGSTTKSRRETVWVLAAKLVRQIQNQQLNPEDNMSAASTVFDDDEDDDEEEEEEQEQVPCAKKKKVFILVGEEDDERDVLIFDGQLDIYY